MCSQIYDLCLLLHDNSRLYFESLFSTVVFRCSIEPYLIFNGLSQNWQRRKSRCLPWQNCHWAESLSTKAALDWRARPLLPLQHVSSRNDYVHERLATIAGMRNDGDLIQLFRCWSLMISLALLCVDSQGNSWLGLLLERVQGPFKSCG